MPYFSIYCLKCSTFLLIRFSAGARAFEVEGPDLKVGEPKFFIDFSPGKACRA